MHQRDEIPYLMFVGIHDNEADGHMGEIAMELLLPAKSSQVRDDSIEAVIAIARVPCGCRRVDGYVKQYIAAQKGLRGGSFRMS
jgi:hypothetical protein